MLNVNEIAVGQRSMWYMREKLGEGDAGEVYRVELTLEGKQAILKRPRKGAFASDALRQAGQIRSEGAILKSLQSLTYPDPAIYLKTPDLLDQSKPKDGVGEGFFIVIERASGFDLRRLQHIAHSSQLEGISNGLSDADRFFLEAIARHGKIPEALLVRSLLGAIQMMEAVHAGMVSEEGASIHGILWNDVKPEHLFWDPEHRRMTVIDWGNSQLLEADKATRDRRYTINDDYRQFLEEMGALLSEACPPLYKRLQWPTGVEAYNAYTQEIAPLKERLESMNTKVIGDLHKLREQEQRLTSGTRVKPEHIGRLQDLQGRILLAGEMPDFAGARNLFTRILLKLATQADLQSFGEICNKAAGLPGSDPEQWQLLADIHQITLDLSPAQAEELQPAISQALSAGVAGDWPTALWELAAMIGSAPLPAWWEHISQGVRRVYLKISPDALPPAVQVRRIFYTLQQTIREMRDQQPSSTSAGDMQSDENLHTYERLLKILQEEAVKKWKEVDPAPPNAGIGYAEFSGFLEEIEAIAPGTKDNLEKSLAQPRAQAEIVMDAWERKEFEQARKALRTLLLWDPERRRLLSADRALNAAPQWLSRIKQGAGADEPFYDYITSIELDGRRLRNRIGPAGWLDTTLDALKRLRKGSKYADLIMEHPEVLNEIPWLNEYRSREVLSLPRSQPLRLERDLTGAAVGSLIRGVVEGKLGLAREMQLGEPLDVWVPEARGSSARVFAGLLQRPAGKPADVAVKVMRPDRVEYALPLFREEAHVLTLLRDVPGITALVECGFMRLEKASEFPSDEDRSPIGNSGGEVVRFGVEETQNFLASMDRYLGQDWMPYLALVRRDHEHNLLKYCDAGFTHGWFLPLRESLLLSIQICDILQNAHERNIVYRDHKILHYYWDPDTQGVVMIDWNIAKRQPEGISDAERLFDVVQFGARALHHILTGRPAAGALPIGPNRPDEIEQSALSYPVSWTFDDERLPNQVKEIIEQALNQGYPNLRDLRNDLAHVYAQISGNQPAG